MALLDLQVHHIKVIALTIFLPLLLISFLGFHWCCHDNCLVEVNEIVALVAVILVLLVVTQSVK